MDSVVTKIKNALTLYTDKLKTVVIEPLKKIQKNTQYITADKTTGISSDLNVYGDLNVTTNKTDKSDGNVTAQDFKINGASLKMRNFIFIGDSWGEGMGLSNSDLSKRYQLLVKNRLIKYDPNSKVVLSAVSGAGFSVSGNSFLDQLNSVYNNIINGISEISKTKSVTDIIVLGGLNDRHQGYSSIKTALSTFISEARSKFPNAKIQIGCLGRSAVFSQCWDLYENSYRAYIDQSAEDGICYIKGSEYCMHNNNYLVSDGYHPNVDGHKMIADFLFNYLVTGASSVSTKICPYTTLWSLIAGSEGNRPTTNMNNVYTMQQDGMITINLASYFTLVKSDGTIGNNVTLKNNEWLSIANGDSKTCGYMNGCEENLEWTCVTVNCLIGYDNGASWTWCPAVFRIESNVENSEIRWKIRLENPTGASFNNVMTFWISPFTLTLPWYMC